MCVRFDAYTLLTDDNSDDWCLSIKKRPDGITLRDVNEYVYKLQTVEDVMSMAGRMWVR